MEKFTLLAVFCFVFVYSSFTKAGRIKIYNTLPLILYSMCTLALMLHTRTCKVKLKETLFRPGLYCVPINVPSPGGAAGFPW